MNEIKATALVLLRSGSASDLKFSDIARELGMTAPALYRYYKDRDDLITALIVDAYTELATSLHASIAGHTDARSALDALCRSYHGWAVSDPVRFGLVFGVPIPGFEVPESAGTTERMDDALKALESVVLMAERNGHGLRPLLASIGPELSSCLDKGGTPEIQALPPQTHQAMFLMWTTLHGFTCLEAFNHMDWMPAEAREQFLAAQIDLCATIMGV
jgi:AcrR family transcriptional regulator